MNDKQTYLLLTEMRYDMTIILTRVEGTDDMRVIANLYRDLADLVDHYAEKIEGLE